MRSKTIGICVAVLLVAGAGGYGVHRYLAERALPGAYTSDFTAAFQAEEETAEALALYRSGKAVPAKVLRPPVGEGKTVYLYLAGLPDRAASEKVVDMLEKEEVPCAWFVEGQNAADEEETMKLLHKKGFLLGNYTWLGNPAFDKLGPEEAVSSLAKTQKAVHLTAQQMPEYFKAPRTSYTEDVLKEAGAAGLSYVVESNVTIRRGDITSKEKAEALVKTIRPGSFIAFEVNRPVSEKAYESGKYDERPAIDKKPTIKDRPVEEDKKSISLAQQLQWLIEALKEEGMEFRNLERVGK